LGAMLARRDFALVEDAWRTSIDPGGGMVLDVAPLDAWTARLLAVVMDDSLAAAPPPAPEPGFGVSSSPASPFALPLPSAAQWRALAAARARAEDALAAERRAAGSVVTRREEQAARARYLETGATRSLEAERASARVVLALDSLRTSFGAL